MLGQTQHRLPASEIKQQPLASETGNPGKAPTSLLGLGAY